MPQVSPKFVSFLFSLFAKQWSVAAARNFAVQLKGRVLGEERTDRSSGWIWADLYIVGLEERSRMGGSIRGLFLFDWRRAVIASSSFSSCHVLALILKSDGGAVQCTVKTTSSEGQLSYLYFVVNGECFFTCVKIQRPPTIALSVGGHTSYTDGTVTLPAATKSSLRCTKRRTSAGASAELSLPGELAPISVQPMPVLIIRRHLNSPTLTLAGSWKCAARVRTALSALACPVVSSPAHRRNISYTTTCSAAARLPMPSRSRPGCCTPPSVASNSSPAHLFVGCDAFMDNPGHLEHAMTLLRPNPLHRADVCWGFLLSCPDLLDRSAHSYVYCCYRDFNPTAFRP
ncbi:hypothetical protein C8R43DRAFT_1131471 [Mycena crocata]|nr:hypothetical protein C8R43DRAFT_1131471 [Mycena crocata]